MTSSKNALGSTSTQPVYYPVWDGQFGDEHIPPKEPGYSYVGTAPQGLFDAEPICPHLITEIRGMRVVVPLGTCGDHGSDYDVSEFCCQLLPQRELNWGFWYPIYRIKLSGRVKRKTDFAFGTIRVVEDGKMQLYCATTGGYFEWVPIPGCTTQKRPGRIYERWDMIIPPLRWYERPQVMVRYDGETFEYYPD